MWIVLMGAVESILRRAPRGAHIIDIRQGTDSILVQSNYVRINLNHLNKEQVKEILRQYCHFAIITKFVSFTERYLLLAAELNDEFKIKANSIYCVQALCNKALMRSILKDKEGAGSLWFALVAPTQISETLQPIDFDVIIKPVDGSGSYLISKYAVGDESDGLAQKYADLEHVLIEQFIVGREFSVEALSQGNTHQVIAITEKEIDDGFIESGHTVPAQISQQLKFEIELKVVDFLNTIGLYEGPSHTEVIVNDSGVHLVESHPRTGGDRIVSLVRLTTGIDLISCYLHQIATESYVASAIQAPIAKVVFIHFPRHCVYNGLPDMSYYREHIEEIEVNLTIGQPIEPPTYSGDRHALVVVYGQTDADCTVIVKGMTKIMHKSARREEQ